MTTDFDRHQAELYDRKWSWGDMPFYHGRGRRQSVSEFHDLDFLDVYERVYGRQIGANGIGPLREVALADVTSQAPVNGDPARRRDQQQRYAEILQGAGATVHWIDWAGDAVGATGPGDTPWAVQDLLIVNGGAIVPKPGGPPASIGRGEWLAHWAFWNLNIPTLLTINGGAVAEAGATVWLAQDVYVVGLSPAYDEAGLEQLLSMVRLTAGVDALVTLTIRCQGSGYFDSVSGAAAHVTDLIAPLDLRKVLCYPPGIDAGTLIWLERNGYQVIEADREEHIRHRVCSLQLLEPGRVVMPEEAPVTVNRVRNAGLDVVTTPYSEFHRAGAGFRRTTLEIQRQPGPGSGEA